MKEPVATGGHSAFLLVLVHSVVPVQMTPVPVCITTGKPQTTRTTRLSSVKELDDCTVPPTNYERVICVIQLGKNYAECKLHTPKVGFTQYIYIN